MGGTGFDVQNALEPLTIGENGIKSEIQATDSWLKSKRRAPLGGGTWIFRRLSDLDSQGTCCVFVRLSLDDRYVVRKFIWFRLAYLEILKWFVAPVIGRER